MLNNLKEVKVCQTSKFKEQKSNCDTNEFKAASKVKRANNKQHIKEFAEQN